MNICLKNISVNAENKSIISSVSTLIPSGKTTVIIGENGSGKSTLLKAVSALIPLAAGRVFYGDTPLEKISTKELAKIRAVVMQNPPVPFGLRVKELLHLARYARNSSSITDTAAIEKAAGICGCDKFTDRRAETLSGGEMRRVYLALALAQEPEILFLDEAEANTDAAFHAEFPALLQTLKPRTVVMVTHDLDLALKCADRIIGMKSGHLEFATDPNADDVQETLTRFTNGKWKFFRDEDGSLRALPFYC